MFSHCRDDFSGYENPFYEEVQDHRSSSGSSHEVFEEQPPQEEATPRLAEGRESVEGDILSEHSSCDLL